ncbi:hypothetical protein MRX96_004437 [Rhipicephalus microplus]
MEEVRLFIRNEGARDGGDPPSFLYTFPSLAASREQQAANSRHLVVARSRVALLPQHEASRFQTASAEKRRHPLTSFKPVRAKRLTPVLRSRTRNGRLFFEFGEVCVGSHGLPVTSLRS